MIIRILMAVALACCFVSACSSKKSPTGEMKRQLTEDEAAGMTVNERLYLSGLMDDFDKAVAKRNQTEMRLILEKVHFDPETAEAIAKSVLGE